MGPGSTKGTGAAANGQKSRVCSPLALTLSKSLSLSTLLQFLLENGADNTSLTYTVSSEWGMCALWLIECPRDGRAF